MTLFERKRVPLMMTDPDVRLHVSPRCAQEWSVNLDVADEAMPKIAEMAVQRAADDAAHRLLMELWPQIHTVASALLCDPSWAKPIIEDELRKATRVYVREILNENATSSPSGDYSS